MDRSELIIQMIEILMEEGYTESEAENLAGNYIEDYYIDADNRYADFKSGLN